MNWKSIFEKRIENDSHLRWRIERFRKLREQAKEMGQKLSFEIDPSGFLRLFFIEKNEKKILGFTVSKEARIYFPESLTPYLDSHCSTIETCLQ